MDQKWVSLSMMIDESTMPYPGDDPLTIKWDKQIKDVGYNLSNISLSMHLGTHVDYKKHVLDVEDDVRPDYFIGKANVIHILPVNNILKTKDIEKAYLASNHLENKLMIETSHQSKLNTKDYFKPPMFEESIFDFLKKYHINLLGSDLPSYEYHDTEFLKMHKDLLGHGIYLIENMINLKEMSNHIEMIALPLPIKNLEASILNIIAKNL
jgi:kynurenine formamidase